MVTDVDLFYGYFIKIDDVLPGLFADGDHTIGMLAGMAKFLIVDLYVDTVVLFRITFVNEIVNSNDRPDTAAVDAEGDLMT